MDSEILYAEEIDYHINHHKHVELTMPPFPDWNPEISAMQSIQ